VPTGDFLSQISQTKPKSHKHSFPHNVNRENRHRHAGTHTQVLPYTPRTACRQTRSITPCTGIHTRALLHAQAYTRTRNTPRTGKRVGAPTYHSTHRHSQALMCRVDSRLMILPRQDQGFTYVTKHPKTIRQNGTVVAAKNVCCKKGIKP
jgi:hypothetical protein